MISYMNVNTKNNKLHHIAVYQGSNKILFLHHFHIEHKYYFLFHLSW